MESEVNIEACMDMLTNHLGGRVGIACFPPPLRPILLDKIRQTRKAHRLAQIDFIKKRREAISRWDTMTELQQMHAEATYKLGLIPPSAVAEYFTPPHDPWICTDRSSPWYGQGRSTFGFKETMYGVSQDPPEMGQ